MYSISKRCVAEFLGTLWLVFGGCGSAVIAAVIAKKFDSGGDQFNLGIGLVGVSLAFGLTVLTMAYAIGHISGCHLNPAVSFGALAAGRFPAKDLVPYIIAQTLGAVAGAGILYFIMSGNSLFKIDPKAAGVFATNGYGEFSPGAYPMVPCLVAEVLLTFFFLLIILGSTDKRAPQGFAPIPIGFGLTLIHLIGIPITNLSVNPARSTGPAVFVQGEPLNQLWFFWAAPIAGAVAAGLIYRWLSIEDKKVKE